MRVFPRSFFLFESKQKWSRCDPLKLFSLYLFIGKIQNEIIPTLISQNYSFVRPYLVYFTKNIIILIISVIIWEHYIKEIQLLGARKIYKYILISSNLNKKITKYIKTMHKLYLLVFERNVCKVSSFTIIIYSRICLKITGGTPVFRRRYAVLVNSISHFSKF